MKILFLVAIALAAGVDPAAIRDERLQASVQRKLGRPYQWGAEGLKAYDCSGFVWRAFRDAGVFFKRTTARKMYYAMPRAAADEQWRLGTLVFFNRIDHVGIVRDEREFYHASTTFGTTRDDFGRFWLQRIRGFRRVKTRLR